MGSGPAGGSDKGLSMSVFQTLRLAWADPDLRARILFVLAMFAVYTLGIHVQVPIPGIRPEDLTKQLEQNQFFQLMNAFGGGALRRLSIFALGLNPYITASIILQILTQANPKWKMEMREGGEYARRAQNKRTRLLSLALCLAQGWGLPADDHGTVQNAGHLHAFRDLHGAPVLDGRGHVRAVAR